MSRRGTGARWALLVVNVLGLAVFAMSYAIAIEVTETKSRSEYSYLEHAGAIDANVLARLPEPGFATDPHGAFVSRIAGPALSAQRSNALTGLIVTSINVVFAAVILVKDRRAGAAPNAGG